MLGTLTGKYECYLTHFAAPFSTGSAPLDDVPDDVRRGLDFVDHGGDLAGEEAAVFQVALLTTALRSAPTAQGFSTPRHRIPPYSALE